MYVTVTNHVTPHEDRSARLSCYTHNLEFMASLQTWHSRILQQTTLVVVMQVANTHHMACQLGDVAGEHHGPQSRQLAA